MPCMSDRSKQVRPHWKRQRICMPLEAEHALWFCLRFGVILLNIYQEIDLQD